MSIGETGSRSNFGHAAGFAASEQVSLAGRAFLLDGTRITNLPARAVVTRIGRWSALPAAGFTEADFICGRVDVWFIPKVGIGRSYWGIG